MLVEGELITKRSKRRISTTAFFMKAIDIDGQSVFFKLDINPFDHTCKILPTKYIPDPVEQDQLVFAKMPSNFFVKIGIKQEIIG